MGAFNTGFDPVNLHRLTFRTFVSEARPTACTRPEATNF